MPAHVVVRDLWKRYGDVPAVRGVEFAIEAGTIFGLLGPNGAGKTSTLECLIGLREPDRGEFEIGGIDARRRPQDVKQKIGVALQNTALQDAITPREALALFGSFYRERDEPEKLIERFALREKAGARFGTLSGGERQRLALALAFVNRPGLVVLDEPTAGLDPQSRRELREEIKRMKTGGCTVLLSTHDLDEAEELCDRVAIIDHGTIVAAGAPRDLIVQADGQQLVALRADRALEAAAVNAIPGVSDVRIEGLRVEFHTNDATAALAALTRELATRGVRIVELRVSQASLEDVFLHLTREGKS